MRFSLCVWTRLDLRWHRLCIHLNRTILHPTFLALLLGPYKREAACVCGALPSVRLVLAPSTNVQRLVVPVVVRVVRVRVRLFVLDVNAPRRHGVRDRLADGRGLRHGSGRRRARRSCRRSWRGSRCSRFANARLLELCALANRSKKVSATASERIRAVWRQTRHLGDLLRRLRRRRRSSRANVTRARARSALSSQRRVARHAEVVGGSL